MSSQHQGSIKLFGLLSNEGKLKAITYMEALKNGDRAATHRMEKDVKDRLKQGVSHG